MKSDEKTQVEIVHELVEVSDTLCSAVIAGKQGQMQLALNLARVLSELKRTGFKKNAG